MHAADRDYYLKRASEEDRAARSATSVTARWRHEELASLYRLRIETFERSTAEDDGTAIVHPFILVQVPPETEAAA